MDQDELFMKIALDLASKGQGKVEPNPMVGALLVREGEIVGKGFHRAFGGLHAEVEALEEAGRRAEGADLFVTLEPCCHAAKTPPCTRAILAAGVVRVVTAMGDPDERCSGRGHRVLKEAGIHLRTGVLEEQALALNAPYVKLKTRGLPFVIAKWAMTLDGKISKAPGKRAVISCRKSREWVHRVRGRMDAVLVGVGTVLADNPQLTCRLEGLRSPRRVVLDSAARTPLTSHIVRMAPDVPTLVVVGKEAPADKRKALESAGVEVVSLPGDGRDFRAVLRHLGERQVTNLLVEGGSHIFASAFETGEVDRVMVFLAPRIFGGDLAPHALAGESLALRGGEVVLEDVVVKHVGDDILVEGRPAHPRADEANARPPP